MAISKNQPMRSAEIEILDSVNEVVSDVSEISYDIDSITDSIDILTDAIADISDEIGEGFSSETNIAGVIGIDDYISSGTSENLFESIDNIIEQIGSGFTSTYNVANVVGVNEYISSGSTESLFESIENINASLTNIIDIIGRIRYGSVGIGTVTALSSVTGNIYYGVPFNSDFVCISLSPNSDAEAMSMDGLNVISVTSNANGFTYKATNTTEYDIEDVNINWFAFDAT